MSDFSHPYPLNSQWHETCVNHIGFPEEFGVMISGMSVQRVVLNASPQKAKELIQAVARQKGFEITKVMDLNTFVRRETGMNIDWKICLLKLHMPSLILGSALLGDSLPLLLPVGIILREISKSLSELNYPNWDTTKSPTEVSAQYCMEVVYHETAGLLNAAICESLADGDRNSPTGQSTLYSNDDQ